MASFALNQNLQQAFTGSQIGQNVQSKAQFGDAQVMDNPFPSIGLPGPSQSANPGASQSLGQAASGQMDFEALAKQYGIQTTGLDANPEKAQLQLMQRINSQKGATAVTSDNAQKLMAAFQNRKPQEDPRTTEANQRKLASSSQRTLKALLGDQL